MSKHQRWYDAIIARARTRALHCYYETHHVLPRSLGGDDDPSNLVDLTYREHFLAHWLLTHIHDGKAHGKMVAALNAMSMPLSGRPIIASWQYEIAKRLLKQAAMKRLSARRVVQEANEQRLADARRARSKYRTLIENGATDKFLKHQMAQITALQLETQREEARRSRSDVGKFPKLKRQWRRNWRFKAQFTEHHNFEATLDSKISPKLEDTPLS